MESVMPVTQVSLRSAPSEVDAAIGPEPVIEEKRARPLRVLVGRRQAKIAKQQHRVRGRRPLGIVESAAPRAPGVLPGEQTSAPALTRYLSPLPLDGAFRRPEQIAQDLPSNGRVSVEQPSDHRVSATRVRPDEHVSTIYFCVMKLAEKDVPHRDRIGVRGPRQSAGAREAGQAHHPSGDRRAGLPHARPRRRGRPSRRSTRAGRNTVRRQDFPSFARRSPPTSRGPGGISGQRRSNVCVVPGGKPIMYFTMTALLEPGDEVIYPDPSFPIYESVIRFLGATPVADAAASRAAGSRSTSTRSANGLSQQDEARHSQFAREPDRRRDFQGRSRADRRHAARARSSWC